MKTLLSLCLSIAVWSSIFAQISVEYSVKRGMYNNAFTLELSSPEDPNATIVYTRNNKKPTTNSGIEYTGPITINSTTSIRAIAYGSAGISKAKTHTYIFLNEIISAGYMENNITNAYANVMEQAFKSLPSISIVDDNISGGLTLSNETEVSAEMLFPNGKKGFSIQCGIQTWGGSPTNPKKSYRLEFKSAYGESKLEYDIFDEDEYETHAYRIPPVKEFDKLLLRTGSQDGLNGEFGNENLAQFVRNRVLMDASIELGHEAAHGRFVHVFINGKYEGHYHLMERPDASWFESYYGFDKDDYEVRRASSDYWDGSGSVYTSIPTNLSSSAAIANTNNYIDLENSANYLVMMSYASGFDWSADQNNLSGGHSTPGKVPYKFVLWDVDLSIGNGGRWHPSYSGSVNYFQAPVVLDGPVPGTMVGNTEYNVMLADKLQCACFDEGVFTPAVMDSMYMERANQIDTSLIAESARWGNVTFTGNGNINVSNWSIQNWNSELSRMRNSYIPQRTNNIINHFKVNNIYPSANHVEFSSNEGIVPGGFQLTLTNTNAAGNIYYTLDGSDPRMFGGAINPNAILYSGPITLPAGVYDVKARVRVSQSNWSAMCPKRYYVGQEYSNLRFNEIHYNPIDDVIGGEPVSGKEFEFVELHNRGNTAINLTDVYMDSGVTFTFPDGAMIGPGGFVVLADDADNFNYRYGFNPDYIYNGKLENSGEKLRILDPEKETIDKVDYKDTSPWNPIPDFGQFSLAVIDPWATNNSPVNWTTQIPFYTPKAANIFGPNVYPDYSGLVINEIHYNPIDSVLPSGVVIPRKDFEFVELKNTSSSLIFLVDLEFTEGVTYKFKDTDIIPPNGFFTVAEDSMWFHKRYGFAPSAVSSGKLSNNIDTLVLKDIFDNTVDSLEYRNNIPWDPNANSGTNSLGLIDATLDNTTPVNWSIQSVSVTPNAENVFDSTAYPVYDGLVINEIHYNPANGNSEEFIEIHNTSNSLLFLENVRLAGGINYTFPSGSLIIPGGYLTIAQDLNAFQAEYNIPANGMYTNNLADSGDEIRLEDFFGTVLDQVNYSSSSPWDPTPAGGQYSLALIDPLLNNQNPVNWSNQDVNYTPNAPNTFGADAITDFSNLVINEIHYSPEQFVTAGNQVIPGSFFEFIEIHNKGNAGVNLSSLKLINGVQYDFPTNFTLQAGGFFVIAQNAEWFQFKYGVSPSGVYSGQLSNIGATLQLQDFFGNIVDQVSYSILAPWDSRASLGKYSLALKTGNIDNAAPASWSIQLPNYSPFAINTFDADGDGIEDSVDSCPGFDNNLIGQACDDGDNCTSGELYDVNCGCSGGTTMDSDNDGICDPNDSCPNLNNNLIDTSCDDGDPCTTGETYNANCGCTGGTFQDSDFDGVCDANDNCPNFNNNLINDPCNDGNVCTTGETYDVNCGCSGGVFQDSDNDGVCDANDMCTGFDDSIDVNNNGIPDGCESCPDYITESNFPSISRDTTANIDIKSNGTVNQNNTILYKAGNSIELVEEFEVKLGATFVAEIGTCL